MADDPGPMIPGRQAPPAKPKRFYAEASVGERDGGFALLLDGRPAKTPARRPLALPSEPVGLAVAAEWDRQVAVIDPAHMPLTRIANSAIDGVAEQMEAVAAEVKTYLGSDLLVYGPPTRRRSSPPRRPPGIPCWSGLGGPSERASSSPRA